MEYKIINPVIRHNFMLQNLKYEVDDKSYNGDLEITYVPKGSGKKFTADVNVLNQIKDKTDKELNKRGVEIQKSKIFMDEYGNIKYQAQYKKKEQFGIAIGAIISSIIKAIIQAIKAIIKFIINAIKQLVAFLKKLIIKIFSNLKDLSGRVLGDGREEKEIDPENPSLGENGSSSDTSTPKASNLILPAIIVLVAIIFLLKK